MPISGETESRRLAIGAWLFGTASELRQFHKLAVSPAIRDRAPKLSDWLDAACTDQLRKRLDHKRDGRGRGRARSAMPHERRPATLELAEWTDADLEAAALLLALPRLRAVASQGIHALLDYLLDTLGGELCDRNIIPLARGG